MFLLGAVSASTKTWLLEQASRQFIIQNSGLLNKHRHNIMPVFQLIKNTAT
ncbi:hypothetical protein XNC1_2862 [Xenorhabdus nematophila ATCC 19061]|uniref:Uncharacterized protein n=1 Tax=Xenorhabdus nematophila (strain ATCC 19061 / DSM 3370 / CCUG 14189 / LMG 1036 / NCIMB 9965 / AN6) TaxID=406817 RepID=D3VJ59_XENNA|nr:hypothetical protein XNC1_2862 [Xenorhabdus nematophila ATCC 19061]